MCSSQVMARAFGEWRGVAEEVHGAMGRATANEGPRGMAQAFGAWRGVVEEVHEAMGRATTHEGRRGGAEALSPWWREL